MTDLFLALTAGLAFIGIAFMLRRAYMDSTPVEPEEYGPVLHFADTSTLLEKGADHVTHPALAQAMRDRAAQLFAHGD